MKFFLEQCLCSVLKAGEGMDMEVIVVDNGSSDGSRLYLEPLFPQVRFFWEKENRGFGRACNYGLERSTGACILFLNPDTIVPEDCFQQTVSFLQSGENIGALGVRMIDGSGCFLKESKRGIPSVLASFFKFSGLIRLFPRSPFFARYYSGHLPEKATNKVPVLSGAYFLVSRDVLNNTGGFDEAFFMYGEDIDLSYRIEKAGYDNYYFPGVTIIHFKGESTAKTNVKYLKAFYRAMSIFVKKHYPWYKAILLTGFVQCMLAVKRIVLFISPASSGLSEATAAPAKGGFLVFGTEDDYAGVREILSRHGIANTKYGGAGPAALPREGEPVFCEGAAYSFKEIIDKIDGADNNRNTWIHACKSHSLVSSASSTLSGMAIGG